MKYIKSISNAIALVLCLTAGLNRAYSQTITWDGGAGTNNWEDANNWNPNGVPCSACDVIVRNDSVSLSSLQKVKSVRVQNTGTFTVLNIESGTGILSITASAFHGLTLLSTTRLRNSGTINIASATLNGVRNLSGVFNDGTIEISGSGNDGFYNTGTLINNSLIDIENSTYSGLENDGGTVDNFGDIEIETSDKYGVKNHGTGGEFWSGGGTAMLTIVTSDSASILTSAKFINEDDISITGGMDVGIQNLDNTDSLINRGLITLVSTTEESIENSGTGSVFFNDYAGTLTISMPQGEGIVNNAIFDNYGTLSISDSPSNGILNGLSSAVFTNGIGGSLTISEVSISIYNQGVFLNKVNGNIQIDECSTTGVQNENIFTNEGSINIDYLTNNGTAVGIINGLVSATFTNGSSGSLTIKKLLTGIQNQGVFLNEIGGTIDLSELSSTGVLNQNIFTNEGVLEIYQVSITGLMNEHTFKNFEVLKIYDIGGSGVYSFGTTFTNEVNATIEIDDITANGMHLSHDFINKGDVIIDDIAEFGIKLIGSDTESHELTNTGLLKISKATLGGIGRTVSFTEPMLLNNSISGEVKIDTVLDGMGMQEVDLINEGSITINNTTEIGLLLASGINTGNMLVSYASKSGISASTLTNSGYIKVDSVIAIGTSLSTGIGIIDLHNIVDGKIEISRASLGLSVSDSLYNSDTILISQTNRSIVVTHLNNKVEGVILCLDNLTPSNVERTAVQIEDGSVNNGYLLIKNAWNDGLRLTFLPDTLRFHNFGTLEIMNCVDDALFMSQNTLMVNENSGLIQIDSSYRGLTSSGRFINHGNLEVSNTADNGLRFSGPSSKSSSYPTAENNGLILLNNNCFSNAPTCASLSVINDTTVNGLNGEIFITNGPQAISNSQLIINHGLINTTGVEAGISMSTQGAYFINYGNMNIVVNDNGGRLLYSVTSDFDNFGSVNFQGDVFTAIDLNVGSKFNNFDDANLFVRSTGTVIVRGNSYGTFSNSGPSELYNHPCGLMYFQSPINTSLSPVTGGMDTLVKNEGLIVFNSIKPNIFNSLFLNDGLVQECQPQRNIHPENIINNGLVIHPLFAPLSDGVEETNIITAAASPSFSIGLTWYTTDDFSVSAGTYTAANKSFLPNSNAVGEDSLYAVITDGTCSFTIAMPISEISTCGTLTQTATFTQSTSTDWHTPENWDTDMVPDPCTIAIIPNNKECTITTGRKARALRILSETGSIFDAELGVVLEVNPID